MPEVIEIVSSPVAIEKPGQTETSSGPLHLLPSDDFTSSIFDEDDWLFSRPVKRQRSNTGVDIKTSQIENSSASLVASDKGLSGSSHAALSFSTRTGSTTIGLEDDFSDDIIFTSSAPEPRSIPRSGMKSSIVGRANDGSQYFDDEILSFSQPTEAKKSLSERTTNLLANINSRQSSARTTMSRSSNVKESSTTFPENLPRTMRREVESDQIFNSSPPILSKEAKTKRDDKEAKAAAKAAERAASKVAKEAAKAEERELKRIAKEEKAREKQLATDIAEVNKSKHDKKNSTPEMIVLLPDSLSDASVRNQVLEYMKRLGVDTKSYKNDMKPGNVVRWKRKVRARFDDEAGRWEPVPEFIQDEKHVLCHITSTEFVDLAVASITPDREIDTQDLNLHVTKLTNEFPGCKIIYLIESLGGWMRKNRNNRNRAYQDAIRSQNPEENEGQNKRKRKQTTAYVDEDSIEDALLQLQVKHGCLIYQTSCAAESAEWIKNFTEHISTIPYRQERLNAQSDAAFCMDVGQVKTGDNAQETYIRMLQEVHRLTPAMAYGVANLYPNVLALVCAFREHGPNMLEHVKKSANKNGGVTEARLGPAMSKRLFKVFLGANPSSTDGIA